VWGGAGSVRRGGVGAGPPPTPPTRPGGPPPHARGKRVPEAEINSRFNTASKKNKRISSIIPLGVFNGNRKFYPLMIS
jgi:hypothetical protein